MTNGQMLAELYRRLNYDASPPAAVTTRLQSFLNMAHRRLLVSPGLEQLRDSVTPFTTVTHQQVYGLPQNIARIRGISDRTNDRQLVQRSLEWLRSADPGLDAVGEPEAFVPLGLVAVNIQPSDASELFIDSTAAGDTNTVYLEGTRTGGYPVSLSKVMTGTVAVSVSLTTLDIIEVTKLYLSAAAVGTVTLHEDSGSGAELARIAIGETQARYWGIHLWPEPDVVRTYYVDHLRNISDMSVAYDEPYLPEDFGWLLVEGAMLLELGEKKDDTRYSLAKQAYDEGVRSLKFFVTCPPDYLPSTGRYGRMRMSRLGGWYPADTVVR